MNNWQHLILAFANGSFELILVGTTYLMAYEPKDIAGELWIGGIAGGNYGDVTDSFTLANVRGDTSTAGVSGGN